jgi:hypothetical protein
MELLINGDLSSICLLNELILRNLGMSIIGMYVVRLYKLV